MLLKKLTIAQPSAYGVEINIDAKIFVCDIIPNELKSNKAIEKHECNVLKRNLFLNLIKDKKAI